MDLMDEIASYLETESGFTVRWLANVLSIDINAARQHMSKYLSTNKTTCATYLLVGENLKGSLSFIVSGESEKDHVRSSFKSVHYEDIYAIHKGESVNNKTILQAGEHDQASEILMMSHPSSVHFLNNKSGLIVCPGIEVKPIGQRILSASYVKPEPAVSTKELVKSTVKKAVETPAPAVIKSKSSIQANSFFGSTAAKSEKPVAAPAIAVKSEEKKPTTTSNEDTTVDNAAKKRVGKIADDDDEEFDSEYKPNPSRLKERVDPARKNFSVGETVEEDSSIPIPEDEEEEGKTQGGRGKKSKVPVVVHGAMDDYMEDIAIAEHNRSTTADAPRPKKRKLVEKVIIYP